VANTHPTVHHIPEHDGPGRLGRHVHHDPRSRNYPAAMASSLKSVAHRHYGPILDQGQLGSCTGNALTQALMCAPLHKPGRILTEADAVALYSRATELDPIPGHYPPTDTGSDGLDVCKAAVEKGYLSAYHHAFGLDQALAALVLSPVIIGIDWLTGCDQPDSNGLIRYAGTVRGGHEVCLNAINVEHKLVRALNSWGDGWGHRGAFYMTFDDLGRALARQGDVTVPVTKEAT
jgi:hypothetical protein